MNYKVMYHGIEVYSSSDELIAHAFKNTFPESKQKYLKVIGPAKKGGKV